MIRIPVARFGMTASPSAHGACCAASAAVAVVTVVVVVVVVGVLVVIAVAAVCCFQSFAVKGRLRGVWRGAKGRGAERAAE